jgi:hypothetical protein
MPFMPHPYVTKVTFKDGQIVLTVQVDEFVPYGYVEISGSATQNSGALATFNGIEPLKANPDGGGVVYVEAAPLQEFQNGEEVTVVLRASRIWTTVLTETQDGKRGTAGGTAARDGTVWGTVTAEEWPSADASSKWSAGQASAGDGSSFPD